MSTLLLALAAAEPLSAQSMEVLLREGDQLSDGSTVSSIRTVGTGNDGHWAARVFTQGTGGLDEVLLVDGDITLRRGDALGSAARCCLAGVVQVVFDSSDTPLVLVSMTDVGSPNGSGILRGSEFLVEYGDTVIAPGVPFGTAYGPIDRFRLIGPDRLLISMSTQKGPGSNLIPTLIEVEFDAQGQRVAETIRWRNGDLCPGVQIPITNFPLSFKGFSVNASGQLGWTARLAGDDLGVFLDDSLIALQGDPSPWTGWDWFGFQSGISVNAAGSWAMHSLLLKGGTMGGSGLLVDGVPYLRDGEALPDIAPFALDRVGSNAPLFLADSGDLVWHGSWRDDGGSNRYGVFLNRSLLVGDTLTVVEGETVQSIRSSWTAGRISPDGRDMLVPLYELGSSGEALVRVGLRIGEEYCDAVPNSSGQAARIAAMGSSSTIENALHLRCEQMPLQQFGFFLLSQTPASLPMAGGGPGTLCVGGAIGRFSQQIQSSGDIGSMGIDVDLQAVPQPMGAVAVAPGETWYFSAWFRDIQQSSNFSSGVSVLFR